ncbi:hypothetical protein SDRG_12195 [Saprolegnia diclina VS20]|uniref:Uncharacterized protein n=1 Tax=Saprolegnia diclina (strain VS20) TaxID=1156394 RepID=T0RJR5_SAPDV|nr:hypothetical protein SDRG_12195 [Saprolegnia diclina VS20]EQC30137.1 hypothetical protein SDRG_12195 [Saprolegnia diclina VS20]|eukprot:XP_008616480.1 hypothetical protein SDRG_12195 [Saprolegnia diclina VS20]
MKAADTSVFCRQFDSLADFRTAAANVGHVAARPAPTTFHGAQAIAAGRVPVRGVNLRRLPGEQWMSPRSDIWKDLPANATWTEVDAAAAYASAAAGVKGQLGARSEALSANNNAASVDPGIAEVAVGNETPIDELLGAAAAFQAGDLPDVQIGFDANETCLPKWDVFQHVLKSNNDYVSFRGDEVKAVFNTV